MIDLDEIRKRFFSQLLTISALILSLQGVRANTREASFPESKNATKTPKPTKKEPTIEETEKPVSKTSERAKELGSDDLKYLDQFKKQIVMTNRLIQLMEELVKEAEKSQDGILNRNASVKFIELFQRLRRKLEYRVKVVP